MGNWTFNGVWNQWFGDAAPPPPVQPAAAVLAEQRPSQPANPSPVPGCDASTWAAYETLLRLREGVKYVVYYDSLGKPTGGEGHLILPSDGLKVGDKIPDATVRRWFTHDGADAMGHAVQQARQAGITSQAFLPYLASVCYQLGDAWVNKFPSTWSRIERGEYEAAAQSVGVSMWQKQTPSRVADFQQALRALPPKATA